MSFLRDYFHPDQIGDIVFVLFKGNCVPPVHQKALSFISLDLIDIVDPFELDYDELLEKADRLDLKLKPLFSCIQENLF